MLNKVAKSLLYLIAPDFAARYHNDRIRRHNQRFEASLGLPRIVGEYVQKRGLTVQQSPFRGLKYGKAEATGSALLPKLIGCYEAELNPTWEKLLKNGYDTVIDIGCAEGYYAIGFALCLPETQVYAYDTDYAAQEMCRALAAHNGVESRVTVRGTATFDELNKVIQGYTLIICDCEGCEVFVLDTEKVPAMRNADLMIEAHDHLNDQITPTLKQRFAPTHDIEIIQACSRNPDDYPEIHFLACEDRAKAVNENRGGHQWWLSLRAKQRERIGGEKIAA